MRRSSALLLVALTVTAGALAASWPGRPTTPAPKLTQPGPPPAWIETSTRSRWLAYSTYCWKTTCADFLPPGGRTDLPTVPVAAGQSIRLHFAFLPRDARVTLITAHAGKRFALRAGRIIVWKPPASGVAVVEVRAAGGSASYVARLVLG